MNYKYIIALFGGEEVDEWTPPSSGWVMIKDFDDRKWNSDWAKQRGIFDTDDVTENQDAFLYNTTPEELCIRWNLENTSDPTYRNTGRVYYNEEKKMLFSFTREEFETMINSDDSKVEEILKFIDDAPHVTKDYILKDTL